MNLKDVIMNHNIAFSFDADLSCAIVGSSGRLRESKFGYAIDAHDVVIRFNGAKVEGYEPHVGSRTSMRFMNGHTFAGQSDQSIWQSADASFPARLHGEIIIVKSWNSRQFFEGVLKCTNLNDVYFLKPRFVALCNGLVKSNASCGFVATIFSLGIFSKISLFGFGFHSEPWSRRHYWEKIRPYDQSKHHDFKAEKLIIESLASSNRLHLH